MNAVLHISAYYSLPGQNYRFAMIDTDASEDDHFSNFVYFRQQDAERRNLRPWKL